MSIVRKVSLPLLFALASAPAFATSDCPDLQGHYRVDGFGEVLGDALDVLELQSAGFTDSEVKITGNAAQSLSFWVKSGNSSPMSRQPVRVLRQGVHYDCAGSSLTFRREATASRSTVDGHLEGRTILRLMRSRTGLGLATQFRGGERTTLYSYDSARVSIPKLGTGRTLIEQIRWPGIDEPRPVVETYVPTVESARIVELRRQLDALTAGAVRIGGLSDRGNALRASLSASKSDEVIAFEDRLRDAGLVYHVTRAPIWSGNQYSMEFLFGNEAGAKGGAWHPSVFRVAHELERLQHPMVSVSKVTDEGDSYLAALDVIGPESVTTILKRLRASTAMFSAIDVLDDIPQADRRNLRVLQLRVRIDSQPRPTN